MSVTVAVPGVTWVVKWGAYRCNI